MKTQYMAIDQFGVVPKSVQPTKIMSIPESDIAWSKRQHALMKLGGIWGVPRSGLMLRKTATGFELHELMPHTREMKMAAALGMDVPLTAEELKAWQREDFACIQKRFEAAGLTFTDPKGLLK